MFLINLSYLEVCIQHCSYVCDNGWVSAVYLRLSLSGPSFVKVAPHLRTISVLPRTNPALIQDPGSRIQDPGSWILDPGSWILDPGSWKWYGDGTGITEMVRGWYRDGTAMVRGLRKWYGDGTGITEMVQGRYGDGTEIHKLYGKWYGDSK